MPAKLNYTLQVTTRSGRIKTKYPITCRNCRTLTYGFRKDNGMRFCSHRCSTTNQYISGRNGKAATAKAIAKTKSIKYRRMKSKGDKHWNWQGGVSATNENFRKSKQYKLWRESVLERDGHKCIWCQKTTDLHVDHIKPFAYFVDLRLELTNGRTLCIDCHKKTDTYGGKCRAVIDRMKLSTDDSFIMTEI